MVHTLANDDDDDNIKTSTTTTNSAATTTTAAESNKTKLLCNEVSNNILLMLKECNKLRYHQACEILIQTLEYQYERRQKGLVLIQQEIDIANRALEELNVYQRSSNKKEEEQRKKERIGGG